MTMGLPTYATAWTGTEAIIPWIAITHVDDQGTTHKYRFSTLPLADPITFHGGRKDARLLSAEWVRVSSDALGAPQVATLEFVLDDTDQVLSRWLGNTNQSKLRNALVELVLMSRTDWVANDTSGVKVVWTGRIDAVEPSAGEQTVRITAAGPLAQLLDKTVPDTVIDTTHFSGALARVLGKVEPWVFGTWGTNHPTYGGEWPTIYTGVPYTYLGDANWAYILVCRHEVTSIDSVWVDGVQKTDVGTAYELRFPGFAAWSNVSATGYVDLGGRRYTVGVVTGTLKDALEAGTSVLTVALTSGRKPAGTNENAAAAQLAYFLDNALFGHKETTAISVAANVLPNGTQLRETTVNNTWQEASDAAVTDCAWGLTEPITLRELLTRVCLSGDLRLAENAAGSLCCWEGDATPDVRDAHDDSRQIIDGTLSVRQRAVENIHPYSYGPDLVGGGAPIGDGQEVRDATSITRHGELPAQKIDLWAIRDSADAATIATRRLTRAKLPRTDLTLGLSAEWMYDAAAGKDQVGCNTIISHRSGPGGIVGFGDYLTSLAPFRWWRLGEQPEQAPTTAKEYSGTSNGTYAGSPQLGIVTAVDDGSTGAQFDGTNDKITLSAITFGRPASIEFWICPDSTQSSTYGAILELSGTAGVYWKKTVSKLSVFFGGADHLNTTALTDGVWYHVVISIDGAGAGTFYINGVSDGTFAGYAGYNVLTIGTDAFNQWLKCFGLSDIALWSSALSSANALAHYGYRTSVRTNQGLQAFAYILDRARFDLSTLAMTYDLSEYVNT